MLYLRCFIASFLIFSCSILYSEEPEYESEVKIEKHECLRYLGLGRGPRGSVRISFYNECPDRVSAQVCVEESPGFFRLHKSVRPVPAYGRFDIFSYEGVTPSSIQWVSGDQSVEFPGTCGKI